jgi:hypothetical protein
MNISTGSRVRSEPASSAKAWWSHRRPLYNVALVVAGVAAFLAYVAVVGTRCSGVPDVEISGLTTLLQGFGYLIAMAVANLFYSLGAFSESLLRPRDAVSYRRWAFRLGLGFSMALPFAVPMLVAITGCRPL